MPGRHLSVGKHRTDEETWWQEWQAVVIAAVVIGIPWLVFTAYVLYVFASTPPK